MAIFAVLGADTAVRHRVARRLASLRTSALRVALALLAVVLLPGAARAHDALRRSFPANGARLDAPPAALRLTFSRAVEPSVSEVRLLGANGAVVPLAPPRAVADTPAVLAVELLSPIAAGDYRVEWRIIGADGHPVRGTFAFTVLAGAAAPGASVAPAGPAVVDTVAAPAAIGSADTAAVGIPDDGAAAGAGGIDAGSPAYVAVRWLTLIAILALVGAAALRHLVLPRAARFAPASAELFAGVATERAVLVVWIATIALGVLALLRLVLQGMAATGPGQPLDAALLVALVRDTTWGLAWLLQLSAVLLLLAALVVRAAPGRWTLVAVGAIAAAASPALSGHAMTAPVAAPVAVLLDAVHVIGAGGWLGTLLLLAVVAIPAALRLHAQERGGAVAALVNAFSPLALAFAGAVVLTGAIAAWLHVGSLDALLASDYGRVLLVKLAVVGAVFLLGAYNWRVVRPALGTEAGARRVARTSTVELLLGALVLLASAVLVAVPPPSHDARMAAPAHEHGAHVPDPDAG